MKTIITAKLKLHTDSVQFQALRHTQLAYRAALNFVSQYSFTHSKMSNQRALQRDCYDEIRLKYGLPAQMACNVPRQVGATYQVLWTKVKQNATLRAAGKTKKRYKGLLFICQSCHYRLHADLIGARNVALRTLLVRQDWMSTGVLSVRPDVSCDEAKVARLQRYAELRWSIETSPLSLDMG